MAEELFYMQKASKLKIIEDLSHAHLIGIGGIGMSAIAQYLVDSGLKVSGSDRALDNPENSRIFGPLNSRGIKLFPQNGSYIKDSEPDILIYSTAIEDDNPDLAAGENIPRIHRSEMLAYCINNETDKISIAVSGSCGKTSVTAWLAETFANSGLDPLMIGGGLSNSVSSDSLTGNYRPGNGDFLVFEADESDKSLLNYNPDYAIILNIGTDHYDKNELVEMFREFTGKLKKGAVVSRQVYELLGPETFSDLNISIFDDKKPELKFDKNIPFWIMDSYIPGKSHFSKNGEDIDFDIKLPMPGRHSGLNALSILCLIEMLGMLDDSVINKIESFRGVWRRSDFLGINSKGAKIYDDYAHNVEKIISAIKTAGESGNRVIAVFQPHGFKPLGFMKESLFKALEGNLSDEDIFCLLPVYYAGGNSSFTPSSSDVVKDYIQKGSKNYISSDNREELKKMIDDISSEKDIVLVMGARDNSLSDFALELTC